MNGIDGVYRFLQRTWRLVVDESTGQLNSKLSDVDPSEAPALQRLLHKTIKQVTEALESLDKMNTAVSQLMVFANAAGQSSVLPREIVKEYLRLLAPIAPHICDELWLRLGHEGTMAYERWPQYDAALIAADVVSIAVQVNSKVRTVLSVPIDTSEQEIEHMARDAEAVSRYLRGKIIKRIVYVPGKLINIIAS